MTSHQVCQHLLMATDPRRTDMSTREARKLINAALASLTRLYQDASPTGLIRQAAELRDAAEDVLHSQVVLANGITWVPWRLIGPALGVSAQAAQRKYGGHSKSPWRQLQPPKHRRQVEAVPDWLTSVRSDVPEVVGAADFAEACTVAVSDPSRAAAASWKALSLSAAHLSHAFYGDTPGRESSDIIAAFRRAEGDGRLPGGATVVAEAVHRHAGTRARSKQHLTAVEALQLVVSAYRLAWQVRDALDATEAQR
ncbi:hypothetical protein [Streptomyces sp. NPDC020489]|uniref:hypothetical protein n=1 Tax=Streptomyces sp. NPDC020489 TaxID=3365077 RepID=UPI00379C5EF3